METRTRSTTDLTTAELEALTVDALPDRAAMSLVNANVAAPINAALALNVLSDGSAALANAQQTAPIGEGIWAPGRAAARGGTASRAGPPLPLHGTDVHLDRDT